MAFDFPAGPAVDDVWTDPVTGATYMWNGYAWAKIPTPTTPPPALDDKVDIAGDTMTGPLILSEHPTVDFQAATKAYVDSLVVMPPGGTQGQALVKDAANAPAWGAPIDGMNY